MRITTPKIVSATEIGGIFSLNGEEIKKMGGAEIAAHVLTMKGYIFICQDLQEGSAKFIPMSDGNQDRLHQAIKTFEHYGVSIERKT